MEEFDNQRFAWLGDQIIATSRKGREEEVQNRSIVSHIKLLTLEI